jgi:hypothetical protein
MAACNSENDLLSTNATLAKPSLPSACAAAGTMSRQALISSKLSRKRH